MASRLFIEFLLCLWLLNDSIVYLALRSRLGVLLLSCRLFQLVPTFPIFDDHQSLPFMSEDREKLKGDTDLFFILGSQGTQLILKLSNPTAILWIPLTSGYSTA
jgi:hypothetical protein